MCATLSRPFHHAHLDRSLPGYRLNDHTLLILCFVFTCPKRQIKDKVEGDTLWSGASFFFFFLNINPTFLVFHSFGAVWVIKDNVPQSRNASNIKASGAKESRIMLNGTLALYQASTWPFDCWDEYSNRQESKIRLSSYVPCSRTQQWFTGSPGIWTWMILLRPLSRRGKEGICPMARPEQGPEGSTDMWDHPVWSKYYHLNHCPMPGHDIQ